jgi:sugar phosphate isomerase/epimerase
VLTADDLVLCSGTVRKLGLVDTARVASRAGFDGISVYLREVRAALAEGWTLDRLRTLLDDLNLDVAELDGELDWLPGGEGSRPKPSIAEAVEVATALRARSLSAIETDGRVLGVDLAVDEAAGAFGVLCDAFAPYGVLVHIEYFPFSGIADLTTADAIARAAGRANGGVLVDTWHHSRGPDAGALDPLTAAAPRVFGIQVSDAARTDTVSGGDVRHECMHHRCLPGDGVAHSAAMLHARRQGGCDAPAGIEVFSDALDATGADLAASHAHDALRRVVRAAAGRGAS